MSAISHHRVSDAKLTEVGDEQITSLSAAALLTVPAGADRALIQAESQNVRYRPLSSTPTASIGMQLAAGDSIFYIGDLAGLKFIEEAASAKLNIIYYKPAA